MRKRPGSRSWLPPIGIALLVVLTIADVLLVKRAFDHVDPDAGASAPQAPAEEAPAAEVSAPAPAEGTGSSSAGGPAAHQLPDGGLQLALAQDGTLLRASLGACTEDADVHLAVAGPEAGRFRDLPLAARLGGVMALDASSRDDLVVLGADATCQAIAFQGGVRAGSWREVPSEDFWYLDLSGDSTVHAPGGRIDVPCVPAALSTVGAVRMLCDDGALLGTADGGDSWATLGRLDGSGAMAFEGPGRGVALTSRDGCPVALLSTDNGGAGWDEVTCLDGEEGRAVALRGGTIAVIVDDEVRRSTDAGTTWESVG